MGFFLPNLSTELALNTSSFLVRLMGIVPSGHLPFKCHNWVIGFDDVAFCADTLLLSSNLVPSGWKFGLVCNQSQDAN